MVLIRAFIHFKATRKAFLSSVFVIYERTTNFVVWPQKATLFAFSTGGFETQQTPQCVPFLRFLNILHEGPVDLSYSKPGSGWPGLNTIEGGGTSYSRTCDSS